PYFPRQRWRRPAAPPGSPGRSAAARCRAHAPVLDHRFRWRAPSLVRDHRLRWRAPSLVRAPHRSCAVFPRRSLLRRSLLGPGAPVGGRVAVRPQLYGRPGTALLTLSRPTQLLPQGVTSDAPVAFQVWATSTVLALVSPNWSDRRLRTCCSRWDPTRRRCARVGRPGISPPISSSAPPGRTRPRES